MRRWVLGLLSISTLVFLVSWAGAAVALRFHIVESPLLENAVILVTGIFCILGAARYCWQGVRWLKSTWEARA